MAKVSKKLKTALIEAVRNAAHEVQKNHLPECLDVPPDQWSKEQAERTDMLVEFELLAIKKIEQLLAD